MDAVNKAKTRIRNYPRLVVECRKEGKVYASCVSAKQDIQLDACRKEFDQFKACLVKTAVKLGTKV